MGKMATSAINPNKLSELLLLELLFGVVAELEVHTAVGGVQTPLVEQEAVREPEEW